MSWKRLYRESDDSTMSIENFDYTKLKFPDKVDAQVKESGGGEYEMYSEDFDYINEDVLGANGISFVFQVEVNGHWYGKHYPATLETPEEFPEFEIDDSSSELVGIMFYDGSEKPIDITDKFPSKEQAIKDGNEQWYKEYDWFISVLGEAAEEAECENVSENPPEEEPDYDDYDDRDRYDYYESRRRFSEDTIPQELRDKAMAAQRVLRNNASLPDSELKSFIRRARMMHRDELAQAAEDLLEYRTAAQGVTGDRETGGFAGIVSDFDESTDGGFTIPDSEWKKVVGYIEKGSNFKQVGAMCRRNEMKMKSRYLILKALYQDDLAREFADAANMDSQLISKLDQQIPEVPSKYSSLVKGAEADDTGEQKRQEPTPEPEKKVNISDVLKDIVADKNPILTIRGDWHTFSGKIGNYSVDINGKKGEKAIRLVDKAEYKYPDIIIEYYFPGTHAWGIRVKSSTEYSIGDWDRVRKYAYDPGEGTMKVYKMPKLTKSQQELLNQARGSVNESVDYDDEGEDGWNNYYLEDTGLSDVLAAINDLDYEVKCCVRGGNTGCKTYEELGDYIISLGEQLSEAGENVKYIR